ncbi:hypothetical protein P872_14435 [Rhodonellum psychrophilum GCM71 = DSM 17998]|uniref:Nucleotidyltransferase n=2 Tax=Rhodonellum TaxID=336827 RepID=U5BQF9_9BACT|nr:MULTISPECIES: nucleotidyl transferase AbiEii/AbiGii toxin family protein [Rhodonellum]ERM80138.1 hypothetical protein P872_14435 [Rhodonellum psychrophilum GCM71 = DSM 17998]SDZ59078.1 Predicted nucleotidyltransferase component of viral defense system [Rhodonellum ikkaensis]
MAQQSYKNQIKLLLDVLPEVAREKCFALHGGTAINLFIREMPRLSVDIDLTYVPIEDRATSMININKALERTKSRIESVIPSVTVIHRSDIAKLQISTRNASIKLEVNLVGRGTYIPPEDMVLCDKAQNEFNAFCVIPVVPLGQLYGGKICAALDRQHPRDLFDVKYLLANEGFSNEVKRGFLLCLLGSERPIHEVIYPNLQDQRSALTNQFEGMTTEEFSYKEYEEIRFKLIEVIHKNLIDEDKDFLLSVKNLTPNWTKYDFQLFPSVRWKIQNLQRLKDTNPKKHADQYNALKKKLNK